MPARKRHRRGLLFTHKNGDFGAISVAKPAKLRHTDLVRKVESHLSDRCSH